MREIGIMSSIPEFFKCPISLELFNDPVILCTGQTYDRSSIEKWLSAGNLTCPVTMQKLHDLSIVPNHTLKHLIDQWLLKCNHNHQFHHDNDDDDDYGECFKVDDGCSSKNTLFLSSLKHVLESKTSSLEQKMRVLEKVRFLSKDFSWNNESFIQMGFFSLLLGLVFEAQNIQEMMGLVENSLDCALKMMPFSSLKDLNMLMNESKFESFKVLLQEGSNKVKISLCNIIEVIALQSSYAITKELANKIGNDTKLLQSLIGFLHDHGQSFELSEAGVKAILSLSLSSSRYRENLVKQGVVHSLVTYIVELIEKENKEYYYLVGGKATRVLELVLELEKGKEELMINEGSKVQKRVIKALIKMVFRVSGDEEGSESAVNCVMIMCSESMEVREEAICGGILTQLLLVLQSQCSGRAKSRARMLLKLLRSMWAKGPNPCVVG